ncbi:MAG: FAD-linked oxidase C-terminal domain-containing protein [Acidobacteriota bacterium]
MPTLSSPSAAAASRPFAELTPQRLSALREAVGEDSVAVDENTLERCAQDYTEDLVFRPAAVLLPSTVEQVQSALRFATEHHLPVTPRGAGTGLSGGALPVHGGLVLSVQRLNRIRGIDTRNLTAEAEAGVITGDLQRAAAQHGLYYPPDPGSVDSCLLGGNLAEDSAGPRSCRHGSTRRWVLGLEAVLADGRLLRTGGANRKDVAGYNLTQLLVGSEGTLAVITAATLRLIHQPAATLTVAAPFPTLESAADAVAAIFREGFDPAACEMLEEGALAIVERSLRVPEALSGQAAVLLLELTGSDDDDCLAQAEGLDELLTKLGAGTLLAASEPRDQERLWQVRRHIGEAVTEYSVFKEVDCVAPRSQLAHLVRAARAAGAQHGLEVLCFGHAGDGNLHVNLLRGDLDEATWERRRDAAEAQLLEAVVAAGGSVTGEHGIGWTQRPYLELSVGATAVDIMKGLKTVFDPAGILNPSKIFP